MYSCIILFLFLVLPSVRIVMHFSAFEELNDVCTHPSAIVLSVSNIIIKWYFLASFNHFLCSCYVCFLDSIHFHSLQDFNINYLYCVAFWCTPLINIQCEFLALFRFFPLLLKFNLSVSKEVARFINCSPSFCVANGWSNTLFYNNPFTTYILLTFLTNQKIHK